MKATAANRQRPKGIEAALRTTHFGPAVAVETKGVEQFPVDRELVSGVLLALDEPLPPPPPDEPIIEDAAQLATDSLDGVVSVTPEPEAADNVEAEQLAFVSALEFVASYSSILLKKEFSPSWPLSTKMRESTTPTAVLQWKL